MGLVDHGPFSVSPEPLEVDPTTLAIREHIENVVEKLINGQLDNAAVGRIFQDPLYDGLFLKYVGPLAESLADLGVAIQLALAGEPGDVPSSAHAGVQILIEELELECRRIPLFKYVGESLPDDFASQTYEEILAQAILNQVVLERQCALGLRSPSRTRDSQVQTDGELDSLDEGFFRADETRRSFKRTTQKAVSTEDDGSSSVSTSNGCPRCSSSADTSTSEFLIEEKTEEVTVTVEDNDSDDSSSGVCKSGDDDWSSCGSKTSRGRSVRVPFPEYGLDIVEETSELGSDSDGTTYKCMNHESWEENWLFQRQRSMGKLWGDDNVSMLIPNPNSNAVPRIGDKDVDELSELSEHISIGSIDYSSTSSDEFESEHARDTKTKAADFGQKDSEYTEDYAAYVNRRPKFEESDDEHEKVGEVLELNVCVERQSNEAINPRVFRLNGRESRVISESHEATPAVEIRKEEGLFVQPTLRREPPEGLRVSLSPATLSLHAGKALKLRCCIEGAKPERVIWFHNGEPLIAGEQVKICCSRSGESSELHQLHIFNTGVQDAGTYSIVAVCAEGDGWRDAHVVVRSSARAHHPPKFTSALRGTFRAEKREVVLECQVDGYPEPEVVFQKLAASTGDVEVLSPEKFSIESTLYGEWSLRFDAASKLPPCGKFIAVCKNIYGEAISDTVVQFDSAGWHRNPVIEEIETIELEVSPQLVRLPGDGAASPDNKPVARKRRSPKRTIPAVQKNEEIVREDHDPLLAGSPPKPGTIAAREHEKWLHAAPIPNNPYSSEKLTERMTNKDSFGLLGSAESLLKVDENSDGPRKVNCGPKEIDSSRYKRDYYVPGEERSKRTWVLSPELRAAGNPVTSAASSSDEPDVSGVVAENIARLTLKRRQKTPPPRASPLLEETVQLPSVRDLSRKFSFK